MEALLIPAVAALLGGGVALAARWTKAWRARHLAAWTETARLTGGRFEPRGGSWWRPVPEKVVAVLAHGIQVTVDHFTVSTGKSSTTYTRVVAAAPGATDLEIKLAKEGVLASLGKALGMDDLHLGDAVFDERFLVRCSDDELARAWLDAPVRAALKAMPVAFDVALKKGEVKAQRVGIELVPADLAATMRAVAALAGGGRELAQAWRKLAVELGGTFTGSEDVFVPGRVRLDVEHEGRRLAVVTTPDRARGVCVRRELGVRDAPRFELSTAQPLASVIDAPRLLGAAAARAEASWQALQPARLVCDGEALQLAWAGYVADPPRLRQAFELLTALQVDTPGAYR